MRKRDFSQGQENARAASNVTRMNVYDFDNTILRGDSTARFFAWCLARTPRMWLDAPGQLANAALFVLRLRKKQAFKQRMLRFVTMVDLEAQLARFWEKNLARVKPFYLRVRREDDVVISASPEFIIRPACEALGVACVLGSPVDARTGRFLGANCHGAEKVRRFYEAFPGGEIDDFYSDSYSDQPLASLAKCAFMVRGERVLPWQPAK